MSESEMTLNNTYANRIEGLFYLKSDQKFTVRTLLEDAFGDGQFTRALDVGPGPGHITEPLAMHSKHLTLVEREAQYEPILRKQFPDAEIIIGNFEETDFDKRFNAILLSHVLYYQPAESWLSFCSRLIDLLDDQGELFLILNSDAGDWWKIVSHYFPKLAEHMNFQYKPLSQFKKELSEIALVNAQPYRFQVWIDPDATWSDFVGRYMLEIHNEAVINTWAEDFAQFVKQFKQVDGSVVMDFRSELVRLRRR